MPQERRRPNRGTALISARVDLHIFGLIDQAAITRGWPRSRVVEEGAISFAREIMAQAAGAQAALRRIARKAKARRAGLARAAKARN